MYIYVLFHIVFLYDLSQDIEYDSLYCTVDLVALSILCALPCIFEPQPSTLSVYQSLPTGNHKYILYVRESVSCMRAKSL